MYIYILFNVCIICIFIFKYINIEYTYIEYTEPRGLQVHGQFSLMDDNTDRQTENIDNTERQTENIDNTGRRTENIDNTDKQTDNIDNTVRYKDRQYRQHRQYRHKDKADRQTTQSILKIHTNRHKDNKH